MTRRCQVSFSSDRAVSPAHGPLLLQQQASYSRKDYEPIIRSYFTKLLLRRRAAFKENQSTECFKNKIKFKNSRLLFLKCVRPNKFNYLKKKKETKNRTGVEAPGAMS